MMRLYKLKDKRCGVKPRRGDLQHRRFWSLRLLAFERMVIG